MMQSAIRAGIHVLVLSTAFALASAAAAVDTPQSADAPDLGAVRAKLKAKAYASARDDLLRLVDTHAHADVYNLLGFSLRKTGDYVNAHTWYKKALDFNPDHKGAHEYIGELYLETGRPELARQHLSRLVALCPTGCEEREDLEQAFTAAGQKP